ncbi:hypothetical protein BJ170DRAFT_736497 [Xylariales sp. AK1849]|nr:hypothetical protein BJ170DRAFT_736497 [Xylariales sp. AK1849]
MWPRKSNPTYDRLQVGELDGELQSSNGGDVEKESFMPHSSTSQTSSITQKARQIVLTIICIFCLWIVLLTAWRTSLHPIRPVRYEKRTLECGNTTSEAEARGCVFDLLSHNWVAPPCLDPLSENEYREYIRSPERAFGPYPYFLDRDGKRKVPDERAFSLLANGPTLADQKVFTTREEHLAHCQFLLRRTHRAAQGKIRMNDENLQFWHAEHCIVELGQPDKKPMNELNEGFYVGYSPCTIEVPV